MNTNARTFSLIILPYLPLLMIIDLVLLVRKLMYLYGTVAAFAAGTFLLLYIITLSVLLYIGSNKGRVLFLLSADIYSSAAIPFSVLHLIHKGHSTIAVLHIVFPLILIYFIYNLTSTKLKRMFV